MSVIESHTGKTKAFSKLGKEIRISPKSQTEIYEPNASINYYIESVSVLIGIGKQHSAILTMSEDAWNALNAGAEVSTFNFNEEQKKYKK